MNKYLNGVGDHLKRESGNRIIQLEQKFDHDKQYAKKVRELYIEECISDGVFKSVEDANEVVSALKIRSHVKSKNQY